MRSVRTPTRDAPVCKVVCFNEDKIREFKERMLSPEELAASAIRYKAMGHAGRLAILHVLSEEECCVCDLANLLGQPVSTVSQHLRTLKTAGLLRSRQEGKLVFYSLAGPREMNPRKRGRAKVVEIPG